jgi:hypothetical protein
MKSDHHTDYVSSVDLDFFALKEGLKSPPNHDYSPYFTDSEISFDKVAKGEDTIIDTRYNFMSIRQKLI